MMPDTEKVAWAMALQLGRSFIVKELQRQIAESGIPVKHQDKRTIEWNLQHGMTPAEILTLFGVNGKGKA